MWTQAAREASIAAKQKQKQDEISKAHPFKPTLSEKNRSKEVTGSDFHDRLSKWTAQRDSALKAKREAKAQLEVAAVRPKPEISAGSRRLIEKDRARSETHTRLYDFHDCTQTFAFGYDPIEN